MPTIHEFKQSRFLTKEDAGKGLLLTIKGWHQENVAMENQPPENKPVLDFVEDTNPLVLNRTKLEIVASICGTDELNDWPGHKIVVFHDPGVMMAGKRVGGIGVRAPRNVPPAAPVASRPVSRPAAPPPPEPEAEQPPQEGDDVPF